MSQPWGPASELLRLLFSSILSSICGRLRMRGLFFPRRYFVYIRVNMKVLKCFSNPYVMAKQLHTNANTWFICSYAILLGDTVVISPFAHTHNRNPPTQLLEGKCNCIISIPKIPAPCLASSGFLSSRASSRTASAGRGLACNGCATWKGTDVHCFSWMCMAVKGASQDCEFSWHYLPYNCSRTQSALNPTWPLKMETAEGHNHTLPNGYRMVLAWIPSQPSLSLTVSFRFLLLRLICLVYSILHTDANTCKIKDSIICLAEI